MSTDAIIIEQVDKSFGSVRAVKELSIRVPQGCIYGFLGPNGAGKTTTIRMVMNIIYPDRGRIEVLGQRQIGRAKGRIGYMPEERGMYRKMSVFSVLSYMGAIKGVSRADLAQRVPRWLGRVGLSDWADRKVEELSRGMQQKLQFAVTVINEPDLLILDEPFSGLDPVNLDLIKGIMLKMRDTGRTVIFSTHMMDQAEKLCDRIVLINKGKMVIDGTLDEIRSGDETNKVLVELEGSPSIDDLPGVKSTVRVGRKLEVTLQENADTQELLKALVERYRVRGFEVRVPSLHEAFVRLVEQSNAEDR